MFFTLSIAISAMGRAAIKIIAQVGLSPLSNGEFPLGRPTLQDNLIATLYQTY